MPRVCISHCTVYGVRMKSNIYAEKCTPTEPAWSISIVQFYRRLKLSLQNFAHNIIQFLLFFFRSTFFLYIAFAFLTFFDSL